ncbi:DUF4136 domain-containing protein [Bordetella sp. 2513F-2]
MKLLRLLLVAIAAAALGGCASGPILHTDYDHQADFGRYRTFGFMSPLGTDHAGYGTLISDRLKTAARGQMEMRGYVYAEQDPDLLVNFGARLERRTEVAPAPPFPPFYGYRLGYYGGWPGYPGTDVYTYHEGTLSIDLVDARRKQLVWEGVMTSEVDDPAHVSEPAALESAVARIYSRYPFRAGMAAPQLPAVK